MSSGSGRVLLWIRISFGGFDAISKIDRPAKDAAASGRFEAQSCKVCIAICLRLSLTIGRNLSVGASNGEIMPPSRFIGLFFSGDIDEDRIGFGVRSLGNIGAIDGDGRHGEDADDGDDDHQFDKRKTSIIHNVSSSKTVSMRLYRGGAIRRVSRNRYNEIGGASGSCPKRQMKDREQNSS